ncbi:hypothetical protein LTR36_010918 [Oleoguttula mirabilis]|uniref:Major facilitator superfamily (MFS) profile domain-containing protein n=1 Tax=Oleoguttula mirabilis TaxID=1507867 RepID=A0AAV9J578_9PEZI|nr:hypothetical protein LTR36_010918 [Oleoguttula mirabilis]
MPRKDISFKTSDGLTLRGWFFSPTSSDGKLPCLVMAHGWSALKEMDLDTFAEYFTSNLPINCLVYDNRNFGDSEGEPRHEIIPTLQQSDYTDAITYAQSLEEVDAEKIGVWGSSYSGGHVLAVGAVDRRVKAVLSQVPLVNGWDNFNRLIRPDFQPGLNHMFQQDRLARMSGKEPGKIPVVHENPLEMSSLPSPDSYQFFSTWEKKSNWKNDVTVKSVELLRANDPSHCIHRISPTPLLMTVAQNDVLTPTDLALEAYSRAREPKQVHIIPGGHFDAYSGSNFERNASRFCSYTHRFFDSIGLVTVYNAPIDAKLILGQRYVRVFAYGLVALILAAYLAALGISETQIGIFFGLTLIGDLFVVMLLTQLADTIGLKKILIVGAVSMTASGLVFALSGNYWVLLTAAIVGRYGNTGCHILSDGITLLLFGLPSTINVLLIVILLEAFLEPIYIAPRNALIGALLTPSKRTASLGFISIVKMISNGSGSALTGILANRSLFWLAFALAGLLKIGYATGMLWTFLAIDRKITAEQKLKVDEDGQ